MELKSHLAQIHLESVVSNSPWGDFSTLLEEAMTPSHKRVTLVQFTTSVLTWLGFQPELIKSLNVPTF